MRISLFLLGGLLVFAVPDAFSSTPEAGARDADQALNAAYQSLMGQMNDGQKERLRNAQRAWITFRDKTCSFESSFSNDSPNDWIHQQTHPAQDALCIQRLTLERLAHLERYAGHMVRDRMPMSGGRESGPPPGCQLQNLPAAFTVQAVGVYEGAMDTDIQLETSGHATKSVEVILNRPKENVVLVLMAYDPVLWRIKRTVDTHIAAVIVGGYHAQAVLGIERSVPLLISTRNGRKDCDQSFYAYKAGANLTRANAIVRKLTGREIDRLWNNYRAERFHIGAPPSDDENLLSSTDYKAEDYTALPRFPSGRKGLQHLIELGLLRRASPADVDAWVEKASAKYKKFNPELKVARPLGPQGIYVVLGKMTFPSGLYGGNSVAFLIPPGIPMPDGNPGHSHIYLLEDGSCRGPICQGQGSYSKGLR